MGTHDRGITRARAARLPGPMAQPLARPVAAALRGPGRDRPRRDGPRVVVVRPARVPPTQAAIASTRTDRRRTDHDVARRTRRSRLEACPSFRSRPGLTDSVREE